MLNRIQAQLAHLSKAERRVGEWILANPAAALGQDTRSMAARMGVSQPTLVRFARSLGCEGFQDFRLQLAGALGPERAPRATLLTIARSGSVEALATEVFEFASQVVRQAREGLEDAQLARAVAALDAARYVGVLGFGQSVGAAEEAARRFMRLDMRVGVFVDPDAQALATRQARQGDVLLMVCGTGRRPELGPLAKAARATGATLLALTARGSPLFEAATIGLAVDLPDGGDAPVPGALHAVQSLVVDVLALGVAMRRSDRIARAARRGAPPAPAGKARRKAG